ncbi:polysaccharide lyase family 14 protein [Neolentinus lepideus HHB14362 ss-1]|uniref:Polysaccharide lyase family 14 protein n=1 Tax=Neolentinus lepideus HHB14362 ss-1 TaxID=1314782 RepID=A0A165NZL4_9AGAM|nr:polysaccharide lyase family 14 protein [Neolentinus lepideus HHB14362 ss-1]
MTSSASVNVTDDDSILELFYPANSINPGNSPQGGAEFYAQPLDLSNASTVTLEYSIFFPDDFDWVKAGKLPGIYGGHTGCSGGDVANDCFSTRLMWREGGMGELYLYAPRDQQAKSLCETPPQSICNSTYGLSIGRGSFNFTKGDWTHVKQTVTLNTPGKPDGAFVLAVNGEQVIRSAEVFYRSAPSLSSDTSDKSSQGSTDSDGGLLGSLLGGVRKRSLDSVPTHDPLVEQLNSALFGIEVGASEVNMPYQAEEERSSPVGFSGLFFRCAFSPERLSIAQVLMTK